MKRFSSLTLLILVLIAKASGQQKLHTNSTITGFYSMSVTSMLDTLATKAQLRIVYDIDMIKELMVTDNYVDEPINEVLAQICRENNLYYWLDPDQSIYIIRKPADVTRIKKLVAVNKAKVAQDRSKLQILQKEIVLEDTKKIATQSFKLTGRVIDHVTGESLPAAMVSVRNANLATNTNADGYFTLLNVPADTSVLLINYLGYQADVFALNRENIKTEIIIRLFPVSKSLNEVVIRDKKKDNAMSTDKRRVSVLQISPAKLEELPNIGEKDILRSFQLMPGISASNESSSGAYVRGGTPDQNLVLFDGFTVYQVDHLYGFFSAFNSNAVKDVTLYKGGFSAKYGGRLSSVTDIVGKEGNSKETAIYSDLSLLSANVFLERPINTRSTLLLAYRHSYQGPLYNKIFNKFNTNTTISTGSGARMGGGPPGGGGGGFGGGAATATTPSSSFYDLNAKYTYAPDDKNRFSWSIYQGNDNLDNSRELSLPTAISGGGGISTTDKTTYGNLGSSLKWSSRWNSRLYSNTLLSYSTYHSNRDNSNEITVKDTENNDQTISTGTFEKNNLKDFSLKSDWEFQLTDKVKLLYGGFGSGQNVSYENSLTDTGTLINQNTKAFTTGGYVELELSPFQAFQIKPSIRNTYYDITKKWYYEPRLSATYTLNDHLTLKGATGKFYQFTNRVIKEDILAGSRDFWVLSNANTIPVSTALHYIAGISYETNRFLFDVEAYYKKLYNLSEYSQRQTGRRPGSAGTLEEHFYNGNGYTKGIEFLVQKTQGKYTGWLSYTLSEATNNFEVYGGSFAANQDTGHEFKLVNVYHAGRWTLSATWIYATGKPYTAPLTSYTVSDYTGRSHTFLTISAKNAERMPAYHRLDAAATYDLIKIDSRKTGSIGFSLFNIYNRSNVWYKQYSIVNNQVITSNVNYLGFTPNITLSLKWK